MIRLGTALLAIVLGVAGLPQPIFTGQVLSWMYWSRGNILNIDSDIHYNVHTKRFGPQSPTVQLPAAQIKALGVAQSLGDDGKTLEPIAYSFSPDYHYVVYLSDQLVGGDDNDEISRAHRIKLGDLRTGKIWDTSAWSFSDLGVTWNASSSAFVVSVNVGESVESTISWYMSGYRDGNAHIVRRAIEPFKLNNRRYSLNGAYLLSDND